MTKRRLIYLALVVGFVGLAILYSQAQREALEKKQHESFNRLVHYVAEHGETETPGSGLFKVFKLPVDEMYGEGQSEQPIAKALNGRRDEVFLVSKLYPQNASRQAAVAACERSLRRLNTDRLDLYLLHWRGEVPLAETMHAFRVLQRAGKIRNYGVSNLDLADMQELWSVPGSPAVATDQLRYNLARRGIEWDLLPWLREQRVPIMAYSPIEQARLLRNPTLADFAWRHGMTPAQAALAWPLAKDDVIVIPKTGRRERLKENLGALDHPLTVPQLAELDRLFPPPTGPWPLEML